MSDQPSVVQEQDENHIIAERRAKLAEWRATGKAYPNDFERENISGKIVELYDGKTGEELEANPVEVKVAGRIMLTRKAEMLPVECIVRGYITGSAWKEYQASGSEAAAGLPAGLLESSKLPEPGCGPRFVSSHQSPSSPP